MKNIFSKRSSFGVTPANSLTRLAGRKRSAQVRLFDLTESNPTRCGFRLPDAPVHPADRLYEPDPRGLLRAREAVAAYYASKRILVHPDDLFLTSGTSEAYSFLFHLLCDAGDEVLCASPAYPLIDALAAYQEVRARRSAGPLADPGAAKAVVLVNPANPTGRYAVDEDWRTAERAGAVISDEVFFDFDWSDTGSLASLPRISGASRNAGLHFTLGGVSKMLGLPQMKLAWIALSGPAAERHAAAERLESIADSFLSVNTPSQQALPVWLEQRPAFISEVLERVKTNFRMLCEAVGPIDAPEGGWYAVVPLPEGLSDEGTALRLLEERNVLVHPGYFFDLERESLVVSLLPEPSHFREAVQRLGQTLQTEPITN